MQVEIVIKQPIFKKAFWAAAKPDVYSFFSLLYARKLLISQIDQLLGSH